MCGQDGEDEAHFVFHCKAYTDLGQKYTMSDSPTTHCSMNKVNAFLASKNETEITALATFLTDAMKVRKEDIEHN